MRSINLLPPEIAERRRARQQGVMLVFAAIALAVLLGVFWMFRNLEIGRQERRFEQAQAQARSLEVQVAELQEFAELERTVKDKQATLATVMRGDIAWSRLLIELSMIIPGDSWLTTFTGTATEPAAEGGPAPQATPAPAVSPGTTVSLGDLNFATVTFDFPGVAKWITRLQELKSLQNIWVPSATKGEISAREVVNFSSTAELSPAAASNRFQEAKP